jgi:hypothetical protein
MGEQADERGRVEFSLVRGGPLYQLTRRLRLRRDAPGDVLRLSLAFLAVTWLPLMVLAFVRWVKTGHVSPLAADFAVHARLLIAIPLFFVAEQSLHVRTRRTIEWLTAERWVEQEDAMAQVVAAARRLRDTEFAEGVALLLAVLGGLSVVAGWFEPFGWLRGRHVTEPWSAAWIWLGLVALPIYQFLLYRWLWRWFVWSRLLWQVSRLDLRPVATHPDLQGGLGFLSEPAEGFAYVILGVSAVQVGIWANRSLFDKIPLAGFKDDLAILTVLFLLVTLAPLLAFTGQLWRARFAAVRQYSGLALDYTRLFHQRWIEQHNREGLLGAPDIQSLADLAGSYDVIRRMRIIPFGARLIVVLVCAVVAPVVPLLLTKIPLWDLVQRASSLVMGGLPA